MRCQVRRKSTGKLEVNGAAPPGVAIAFEAPAPSNRATPSPKPESVDGPVHVDEDLLRLRQECMLTPDVSVRSWLVLGV